MDDVLLISCEPRYFIFKGSKGVSCKLNHGEKRKTILQKAAFSCSSASVVSCSTGPICNVSNDQSVFQTNVWLNGIDIELGKMQ